MYKLACVILTICAPLLVLTSKSDRFTEELLVKPLYSNQLYVHFHFASRWNTNADKETYRHTHMFPRPLGELLSRFHIAELHVSLTNGLWRHATWGYPVEHAAPGAEILAWFHPDTRDVDAHWKGLTASLSGLLCASLNFVDGVNSISPEFSFRRRGAAASSDDRQQANASFVRYGSLPREIVCTENLTPWKKLLPCGSRDGLASLLNSGHIHGTRYHSISLRVRPVCQDPECTRTSLDLQQSLALVYDYSILDGKNWSFRKLFGMGLMTSCPFADSSTIYVDVSSNQSVPFTLTPTPDDYVTSLRGGTVATYAKYAVKRREPVSISANYAQHEGLQVLQEPQLTAHQYLVGFGQERGGIVTKLYNNHWSHLDVVVLQNIPWYVPIYLHTFKVESGANKTPIQPIRIRYKAGRQRERPYHLEVLLRLPPKSVTATSIDFDYVFLKWQEYPPDANHGFYIGSAVISALLPLARNFTALPQDGATIADSFNASRSSYLVQIRTECLVITLPTPDFSMPYNVICLTCTVVALAFGPLHNITTKRLVLIVKRNNDKLLGRIKVSLQEWWRPAEQAEECQSSVQ